MIDPNLTFEKVERSIRALYPDIPDEIIYQILWEEVETLLADPSRQPYANSVSHDPSNV